MDETMQVAVVTSRQGAAGNRWQEASWRVDGIVTGIESNAGAGERILIRVDDHTHVYLRTGFHIRLHADEAEGYYFNLVAEMPAVFVICRAEQEGETVPFLVSVSYDEAAAYMESEAMVFPVAMPAEIHRRVEAFVLEHYVPEKKSRRQRTEWSAGEPS